MRDVTLTLPFQSLKPTVPVTRFCEDVEECIERLAQRREPHAVINQLRVAQRERLLVVRVSRSRHSASSSRCAVTSNVPPGVSYAPRDFMPTRRFSTRSMRPTPCFARDLVQFFQQRDRAKLLPVHRNRRAALRIRFQLPSALSGASAGETTHCHIASFGAFAGSSSSPPSWLKCQMLRSRL